MHPLPMRGVGAELSSEVAPPGASGQASPRLPGPWEASWGLQQGICGVFFLNITSLLNILELPRLSEARQPKGFSLLTCDVKIL